MTHIDASPFRTRGRAAVPVSAEFVREIEVVDLELIGEEKGSKAPAVKRITERHHALARCLASGMRPTDAAHTCGYDVSRVSILQADPAFKELLLFYREDTNRAYRDMHTRLAGISLDAAEEIGHRLEEDMQAEGDDKKISLGQLLDIAKLGADRTGFGPQTSSTNVNVNVDLANRLELARKRVAERSRVIEQ